MAMLVGGAWYVHSNWEEFRQLRIVSASSAFIVSVLFLFNLLLRGLFTQSILKAFAVHLTLAECFSLTAVTTMANNVLPFSGGAGIRAVYLKKTHNFPYTHFASTMAAVYILSLCVSSALGLGSLLWIAMAGGPTNWIITGGLGAVFLGTGSLILFSPKVPEFNLQLSAHLKKAIDGWHIIRRSPSTMMVAVGTSLGTPLCAAIGFYVGFAAFNLPMTFPGAVLITVSYAVGGLINLTPGGAGFQELLGLYFATILENTIVETLTVLVSLRLIRVSTSILAGLVSIWQLKRLIT